jgi:hypothetical protein
MFGNSMKRFQNLVMRKAFFILISMFILASCNSVNLQNGANAIASTFKSQSIEVGKSFATDTDQGEVNALTIDLEGVEDIDNDNYPANKVASVSAKLLFDNISQDDIGKFDQVIVTIKNQVDTSEFIYTIEELARVDDFIAVANSYLSVVIDRKYHELVLYIDTTIISPTDHLDLIDYYRENDSIIGVQEVIRFTGFNFGIMEFGTYTKTVELWAETASEKYKVDYHFFLNNDGKDIKICGFEIRL